MRESNSQVLEIGAATRKRERERGECVGSFTVFFPNELRWQIPKKKQKSAVTLKIVSPRSPRQIKEKITRENFFSTISFSKLTVILTFGFIFVAVIKKMCAFFLLSLVMV